MSAAPAHGATLLRIEAVLCLVAARLYLAALPFRWTRLWLGRTRGAAPAPLGPEQVAFARTLSAAIDAISDRVPALGSCMPQAMAAAAMLRLRAIPCVAHFGVIPLRPTEERIEAHVWITVADVVVTGDALRSAYIEIGSS